MIFKLKALNLFFQRCSFSLKIMSILRASSVWVDFNIQLDHPISSFFRIIPFFALMQTLLSLNFLIFFDKFINLFFKLKNELIFYLYNSLKLSRVFHFISFFDMNIYLILITFEFLDSFGVDLAFL